MVSVQDYESRQDEAESYARFLLYPTTNRQKLRNQAKVRSATHGWE